MRITWLGLGIALLMLPTAAEAQHPHGGRSRGMHGAVEKLIEHSEQLGLSGEQIARLQMIQDSADAQNRPNWRGIMAIRRELKERQAAEPDMSAEQKSALVKESGAEIKRLYDQIQANEHSAMREVGKVLTPEQKQRVLQIIKENEDDDGRRRKYDRRGHGRG